MVFDKQSDLKVQGSDLKPRGCLFVTSDTTTTYAKLHHFTEKCLYLEETTIEVEFTLINNRSIFNTPMMLHKGTEVYGPRLMCGYS